MRAAASGDGDEDDDAARRRTRRRTAAGDEVALTLERIAELGAAEEFILTVSSEGFGKRTSAYEYRRTGRGGQGLIAHDLSSAAAAWSPPSRSRTPTRSCWSPTRAS